MIDGDDLDVPEESLDQAAQDAGFFARATRRLANMAHPAVNITPVPAGIRAEWDVPVKVRDGTTLRVNVFRPEGDAIDSAGDRVPVILSAHPYGKDKIPARTQDHRGVNFQYRLFPQPYPVSFSEWTSWEAPDPAFWVPRGYAVVNADLRGGGTSEGECELFSDQEANDYYDIIEWAAAQPWSNGRVGLDGVSYLAISQYKVAALRPPHLAAMCPWEGFSDLYRDFVRPGGVREDGFSIVWSKGTAHSARVKTDVRKEILARTERDEWYASATPRLEQITVPMLVCGSFSDQSLHSRGSFEVFRRAGSRDKWLYTHRDGKWCAYYSEACSATRARFFDHFLRGVDNGWQDEPRVRLAIHDHGSKPAEVRGEKTFPPDDLTWIALALHAEDRSLRAAVPDAPPATPATVVFSTRSDGVRFEWAVPEDIDVIGPMALRIDVELEGTDDAFLFVGVRKLHAGAERFFEGSYGFSYDLVTKGWQRIAHRELDAALSTPIQPVHTHRRADKLAAGEIVTVDVALLPQATRLRRGDILALDIRGTWHFPQDPLRGQFPAAYQASPSGKCILHFGGSHAGQLLLGHRPSAKG